MGNEIISGNENNGPLFRYPKDQIMTLAQMHEHFARIFSTSLSAFLRKVVKVERLSTDQTVYEQCIRSVSNPTCLAIISMNPLQGDALVELPPPLLFPVVERLTGGEGQPFE
ncbi:MAG: hypothetical protein ABIH23_35380, partial [bacterium]